MATKRPLVTSAGNVAELAQSDGISLPVLGHASNSVVLEGFQRFDGDKILKIPERINCTGLQLNLLPTGGVTEWVLLDGDSNSHLQLWNDAAGNYHLRSRFTAFEVPAVKPGMFSAGNSLVDYTIRGRKTGSGKPTSNTWAAHQEIVDSNGLHHYCVTDGTPGSWVSDAWKCLGSFKFASAAVSSGAIAIPAFDELEVVISVISLSATDSLALRFNSDSGNNYSHNSLTATSATSGTATITAVGANTTAQARLGGNTSTGPRTIKALISNRAGTSKVGIVNSGIGSGAVGANSAKDIHAQFEWVNTSNPITSIELRSLGGTATLAVDSAMMIFGRNFD